MATFGNIVLRNAKPSDHQRVVPVMKDWWGGRDLSGAVLKLFFIHFEYSPFVAEKDGELVGFSIEPGDRVIDGIPVTANYLKEGEHKVLFKKKLE